MGKTFAIIIAALIGTGAVLWGLGWAFTPMNVTSASNVRKQYAFAYTMNASLKAAALQACSMQKLIDSAVTDEERTQRRGQLAAIEMNYARIARDYDARMQNAFEAKHVAPSDVPRSAPRLAEIQHDACN